MLCQYKKNMKMFNVDNMKKLKFLDELNEHVMSIQKKYENA